MLRRVERFGIDAQLAVVREFETNLKQGLARTQREDEGVTVLLFLRDRIRLERLPSRGLSRGIRDPRAVRQVELEFRSFIWVRGGLEVLFTANRRVPCSSLPCA